MEILTILMGVLLGFLVGFLFQKNKNLGLKKDKEFLEKQEKEMQKENSKLQEENKNLLQENTKNKTELKNYQENSETQKQDFEKLQKEHSQLQENYQNISKENSAQKKDIENYKEKLETQNKNFEKLQKQSEETFKNLANEILEKNSEKFTNKNQENIGNILKPLKDNLDKFEKTVKENYDQENKEKASLKTEIQRLLELNKTMSQDAQNLTKALKGDTKTQGNWGEMQLEVLLENAGLEKGVHFEKQVPLKNEYNEKQIPDFIVKLPENKCFILDAKVSLIAYEKYASSEVAENKKRHLQDHIKSIKNHITGLSDKNYQRLADNTVDYVFMFSPIEPAFYLAMQEDSTLFKFALEKNIILVSPSTLMAVMRTVAFIWKQENQSKNVRNITKKAGDLYDKFVGFSEDLLNVGKQMDTAKNTYSGAMKKLSEGRGNLVKRAEEMKNLGIEHTKKINAHLLERSKN